ASSARSVESSGPPPNGIELMTSYLLDCNHFSAALRKVSVVRDQIHQERRRGNRFVSCIPVICELEAGILQTAEPAASHRRLVQFLRHIRWWPLDSATARLYGMIFNELQKQGKALSQVDMMLAALARQHKLTILTTDRDFEALPDLKSQNWMITRT